MAIFAPTFEFIGAKGLLDEFLDIPTVECGIAAEGDAAAYAEVWEWGNARQEKQGPKTVRGINPDGEVVWLSSQAPMGYISVNMDRYVEIVDIALGKFSLEGGSPSETARLLENTEHRIMEDCLEIIAENAPVDTGALRDSLSVVDDGDPLLEGDEGGSIESRFHKVPKIPLRR